MISGFARREGFASLLLVLVTAATCSGSAPQVAFKCGYETRFKDVDTGKWTADTRGRRFCFDDDPNSVLRYCNDVYGEKLGRVQTVSENRANELIPEFCEGHDSATCFGHQFTCYVGEFVAKSLVVPQNCTFSHRVQPDALCSFTKSLQHEAELECREKMNGQRLHDFGLLNPCLTSASADMFNGIEFVCCPPESSVPPTKAPPVASDPGRCRYPPETGMCRAAFRKWFYDTQAQTCFQFIYGGCGGNDNRFDDKQACLDACSGTPSGNFLAAAKKDKPVPTYGSDEDDDLVGKGSGSGFEPSSRESATPRSAHETLDDLLHDELYRFDTHFAPLPYLEQSTSVNEHVEYQQALATLENEYEQEMTRIMRNYERAEMKFIELTSSAPDVADKFRDQLRKVYQEGVQALEDRYSDLKHSIHTVHKTRVALKTEQKRLTALTAVQDLIDQPVVKEEALVKAFEKYLDVEQDAMTSEVQHYQRLLAASPDRAANDHQPIMAAIYSSHEAGVALSQRVMALRGLAVDTQHQLESSMLEFSDFFSKIVAQMDNLAQRMLKQENKRGFFDSQPSPSGRVPSNVEIRTPQEMAFAAKYIDNTPGLGLEAAAARGEEHSMRQSVVLISFLAILSLSVLLALSLIGRRYLSRGGGGGRFTRVSSDPHPLSPDEKHINSLQVNGYFNPTYKFFDAPTA